MIKWTRYKWYGGSTGQLTDKSMSLRLRLKASGNNTYHLCKPSSVVLKTGRCLSLEILQELQSSHFAIHMTTWMSFSFIWFMLFIANSFILFVLDKIYNMILSVVVTLGLASRQEPVRIGHDLQHGLIVLSLPSGGRGRARLSCGRAEAATR